MKGGPVASHNTLVLVQKRILSRIWSDIYRDGRIKAHSITIITVWSLVHPSIVIFPGLLPLLYGIYLTSDPSRG